MLPLELLDRLVPPKGSILIQRNERPVVARGIVIPDRARHSARAATAKVLRVSPEIQELAPGDSILLAALVGSRSVRLGTRGEVVVEICKPSQVLAKIVEAADVENYGEHTFAGFTPSALAGEIEPLDEGDPCSIC